MDHDGGDAMRVLVVAAHPDDETLGCGATLAQLVEDRHECRVLILGEGLTSRLSQHVETIEHRLIHLKTMTRMAMGILGLSCQRNLIFKDLPDNRFDTVPLLNIVKIMEREIRLFQPEVIYTHSRADLNIDHQLTARSVLTATRPGTSPVRDLYAFRIPSSSEWAFPDEFQPNVFVDIHRTLERKIEALACYDTELRPFPHPRSPEALRHRAAVDGMTCGLPAAEAFQLIRSIRGTP